MFGVVKNIYSVRCMYACWAGNYQDLIEFFAEYTVYIGQKIHDYFDEN